ncbi:MAG: phosphoesterase, partial [Calditrichaeota bacterium]|nr:phosphoesterase [Calditrichota bacterium]
YNQTSLLRTMEQILGLPPMNQLDAAAKLMTDCFSQEPDLTPYKALPNRIPLDELNPPVESLHGKARHFAELSAAPEFDAIDTGDDDLWNRIIWFATKGDVPYPVAYAGHDED